ncbi:phage holin family protein [Actinoallomurus sp. CA-142502]|uniref:phage holin family protein n=1 Tax=Actinoallomurus sp. CA-142502 TaxID=3239885 RepID=UPI003D8F338F
MAASTSGPAEEQVTTRDDASLGELITDAAGDVQKLLRQELALAKAELREEATRAGKAAGMYGGAGYAGFMVLALLSAAAVIGLGHLIGYGWSALIIAMVWAIVGAVLYTTGRKQMRTVSPKPEQTIETLKEDARWARHPTR